MERNGIEEVSRTLVLKTKLLDTLRTRSDVDCVKKIQITNMVVQVFQWNEMELKNACPPMEDIENSCTENKKVVAEYFFWKNCYKKCSNIFKK